MNPWSEGDGKACGIDKDAEMAEPPHARIPVLRLQGFQKGIGIVHHVYGPMHYSGH